MMAEEADAELQEALDEIQIQPDPINESLIGTPEYPEWFTNKKAAQAGQGFYLTPYKVPRCGRCDNCNPVKGMKSSTCSMVIRDPDRKRKAPTSPEEKPPPKKKTAFIPDRTYTNLDGFEPFLNSVGKHRKINGLEFWFKQTPNNRKSKNDWDFIIWDPKKNSSIYFRDTNGIGYELEGSDVSHLRSLTAMERYWDRRMHEILNAQYLTQQIPTEGSLREAILLNEEPEEEPEEKEPEEEPEKGDDNTRGTDDEGDQTDPEPEPPKEQEPPPSLLMAPQNAIDFKPPSRGVRQNGKAPTQKEKETIRKAMAEFATRLTRANIANILISDQNSSLSSMSRSRVVALMKELSPPPIWSASEEKAYQGALTLKPKTPEAITEFMNRTMDTSYEQVHGRMQQDGLIVDH